ncbi:MAG: DNA polymerase III subunit beta [Spirochaetales bacterium]|nr:DNA polymerase III subunit beta [Spirochaetales bacterium]
MKFNCEKNIILKSIGIAQEIISSRNVLSILSNVLLETGENSLFIKSSDLKLSFETVIPVDVIQHGSVTVYCEKFFEIIRSLPDGEVEFELGEKNIFFIKPVFKKITFNLKSIAAEKYPEIPEIGHDEYFEFAQKDFITMIANTIFAISDDETRYFMNGVNCEKIDNRLIMVASDGRRLSYVFRNIDGNFNDIKSTIIPPKILTILKKLLPGEGNIYIAITDKNVFVKFGSYKFCSNLIDGKFPNYNKVIPEKQINAVTVSRDDLENAVKRVSLMVEQKSRRLYLHVKGDVMIVSSDEAEIGMAQEEISCESNDEKEVTIVLNYMYLLEPLREMGEEKVSIEYTDPEKTITIKAIPDNNILHIIMPMQKK